MSSDPSEQFFEEMLPYLERLDAQIVAVIQLLKDKGITTSDELAKYVMHFSQFLALYAIGVGQNEVRRSIAHCRTEREADICASARIAAIAPSLFTAVAIAIAPRVRLPLIAAGFRHWKNCFPFTGGCFTRGRLMGSVVRSILNVENDCATSLVANHQITY